MKKAEESITVYNSKSRMHFVSAWLQVGLVQSHRTAPQECVIREQDHKKWRISGRLKRTKKNEEKFFLRPT